MFNIESENIVGTNFITIINKLFDDYNKSIRLFITPLRESNIIPEYLLIKILIKDLEIFKKNFNEDIITKIVENTNIEKTHKMEQVLTIELQSLDFTQADRNRINNISKEYSNIYSKISDIQLIFTLIYYQLLNNDMIINSKEIILYSSVLYKILENILKIITLILESINIYRTESTRYIYTKCLTRFYNRIYNSISNDLLNSKYYKITNTYIKDLDITIKDDINNIIPNSNKLQILELINNNQKDNIDPINYDDEMKELENTMRELQKLEDFAKYDTSIIEQRHKIDYFNEYKEYDTFIKKVHGYDKNLNDDLMLTEEEIDSMLKKTCDL